jgi:hypothetical protein
LISNYKNSSKRVVTYNNKTNQCISLKLVPSLFLMTILITGIVLPINVFADVVSPKKQVSMGIANDEVFCKANLFKIIKKSTGAASCVTPETAKKLIAKGWAKSVDIAKIDQLIQAIKERTALGTITKQAVIKQTVTPGIAKTQPGVDSYHVVFQVCAKDSTIRLPEVVASSDSETRYVKLAERIPKNTCEVNAVKIKAANPESIQLTLLNKGGVTAKLTQLENKVNDLTEKLNAERSKLATRLAQAESVSEFKPEEKRLDTLADLRAQLNDAKSELNRFLFAHYMMPKVKSADLKVPTSFAGTPLQGIVVNKLSATPQIVEEGGFDVVFEICAGDQIVRIPSVQVSSDIESKTVRMADKIIPNSCQVSGVKIKAASADLIEVTAGETIKKSLTASNLEQKITDLTKTLQAEKQALKDLTFLNPRPADFNEQASKITIKIIELRAEITQTKLLLYNFLNQVYEQ